MFFAGLLSCNRLYHPDFRVHFNVLPRCFFSIISQFVFHGIILLVTHLFLLKYTFFHSRFGFRGKILNMPEDNYFHDDPNIFYTETNVQG